MQNTITEKEKEAKRKQQTITAMEANYKANLDGLVLKLNEYSKVINVVRALKLKVMENVQFNVEFDGHLEPMLKSIGYVNGVAEEIKENFAHLREVANSIQHSAKESQQSLFNDTETKELSIPEWVLEMSDDLDELEQREFIVAEKLAQAETKMDKIAKLLKDGKTQIYQRNQLTPEQQQKLENDSKTMLIFVQKLSERIAILRQQIRALRSNQKLIHAKKEYRSSGGGEHSPLNDSDLDALDTSEHNASALASELIASISLIDDKMKPPKQNGISKLLKHLDASSNRPPKVVNIVPINIFVSAQKPKEDSSQSIILKPKVAEAQKALIENLMKVRSPRASIISHLPTSQPRPPFSVFGNKPSAATTVSKPTVSTPTQQTKSVSDSGNVTTPVTPSSAAASYNNASTTGRPQPLTSTPKPMFGASTTNGAKPTAFTPQQSTLPFFGSPLNATVPSPLTCNPKIIDENVSTVAATKESEEEEKRKAELEEEIKKKKEAEKEAEAKKKAAEEEAEKKKKEAEQEKAKKEAEEKEEQERIKKLAQEEEEKRKAELEEAEAKATAEHEAQRQAAVAAEEEAKKKQEAAAITTAPADTVAAPISFSFKPVTPPPSIVAAPTVTVPVAASQAPINFSFKPAPTVVKSESFTDIGMEDDGINSALAGTTFFSPPSSNGFGNGGFSSFGGISAFGKQTALNNPFGGGSSSTAATTTNNASTFGETSAFGSTVKNPFGGGTSSSNGSAFGGGSFSSFGNKPSAFGSTFSQQQQSQTTPQKNPFVSGTSAFSQTTKSPFASPTTSTGNAFSSFGNKSTSFGQQASTSTFGGTSAFGGGSSAFGSNSSPFSSASGSAFGGTSAFGQSTKSPFSSAAASNNTSSSTTSAFGGGFSAFGNKAGGFGALAQQANTSSNVSQNTNSAFGSTSAFGGNSAFGPRRQ